MASQCAAKTKTGSACKAVPINGSRFCFFHDPKKKTALKSATSKGGKNRCFPKTVKSLEGDVPDVEIVSARDIITLLSETISQVRRGDIDPRVANAINQCANVILRAREQSVIDERINQLAEKVGMKF